jgi:hypothetical protein
MLPWDLEDWLTDEGDKLVHREAVGGIDSLTPAERLVYEVWLFDTEQRNGGLAQYFCNRGREQWDALCLAARNVLAPFAEFAARVDAVVADARDPYLAVLETAGSLDRAYEACQVNLVSALRKATNAV